MFGIGRLNGQNLHIGSLDISTSQLYTGTCPRPCGIDLSRIGRRFRPSLLHCESHFNRYTLHLLSLMSSPLACRSKLRSYWRSCKFIRNRQKSFRACRSDCLDTRIWDYLWARGVMVDTVDYCVLVLLMKFID